MTRIWTFSVALGLAIVLAGCKADTGTSPELLQPLVGTYEIVEFSVLLDCLEPAMALIDPPQTDSSDLAFIVQPLDATSGIVRTMGSKYEITYEWDGKPWTTSVFVSVSSPMVYAIQDEVFFFTFGDSNSWVFNSGPTGMRFSTYKGGVIRGTAQEFGPDKCRNLVRLTLRRI